MKPQSFVRTKRHSDHPADQEDMYAQTPVLDLITPLTPMCIGWSPAELSAGRRLVCFLKVHDDCKLIVSCELITQGVRQCHLLSLSRRTRHLLCFVTFIDLYLFSDLTSLRSFSFWLRSSILSTSVREIIDY